MGSLTGEEKTLLTKQVESVIKTYRIIFMLSCISIVVIIGIILAPTMYVAIRCQKKKLIDIQNPELEIYEAKGVLGRKYVGLKFALYAYNLDGFMVPSEVLGPNDQSGIQNYLGQAVTIQYIPSISRIRSFFVFKGHGYNFITKTKV